MANSICMEWINSEEALAHHGIVGMKWGKRHGPPYPLSSKLSKAIQKGRTSSGKPEAQDKAPADKSDPHGKKVTLSDKLKAHLAAPGAAALSGVAGIGMFLATGASIPTAGLGAIPALAVGAITTSYREVVNIVARHREKKVRDIQLDSEVDKNTGLKLKGKETSIKEDVKMVNPGYSDLYKNTKHNCALCSVAYDMRRRGFNVTAQKAKTGYSDKEIEGMYKNGKFEHVQYEKGIMSVKKTNDKIMKKLSSQGTGARGIVTVEWKGGGGHAMSYEVTPEGPKIIDAQRGKVYKNAYETVTHSYGYMSVMRTDNLKPNYDAMKKEAIA